ncbi:MAG: phage tail length tape measure family protein [Planctomycetota bacterium]
MATAIGDLVATLGMNVRPFQGAIGQAQGMLSRFGSAATGAIGRIRGILSSVGGAMGLGALMGGTAAIAGTMKAIQLSGVQAAAEKKLQSVLAATGGAAGFTAKELFGYASQLQGVTNYGDEATISMMGVLATFKEIKGDVFKDAVASIQDMSAVLGQDMQAGAVQLGKALNDPIRGVTALRRVGVSFTAEQMAQIKNFQEQGNLVAAQRIILDELKNEFGGAAQAMADPLQQARNAMGDLGERVGKIVKPAVVGMLNAVVRSGEWLMDTIEALNQRFDAVILTVQEGFGGALAYVGQAGGSMGEMLRGVLEDIGQWIDLLAFAFRNFGALAQVAILEIAIMAIETFPQMEGPIQDTARGFVAMWAGVKAFFGTIVAGIVGGLQEIGNVAKAVGAGITAAWAKLQAGEFSQIGSAFGNAFMEAFAAQKDVQAPNVAMEVAKASAIAAATFDASVTSKGGIKNYLEDQRRQLIDGIAQNESAFELRRRARLQQETALPPAAIPGAPGEEGAVDGDTTAKLAGAIAFGSAEAYKLIASAALGSNMQERQINAAEQTADNTARMADAIEDLSDVDEIDIPA